MASRRRLKSFSEIVSLFRRSLANRSPINRKGIYDILDKQQNHDSCEHQMLWGTAIESRLPRGNLASRVPENFEIQSALSISR
jgi:hypothetical protein